MRLVRLFAGVAAAAALTTAAPLDEEGLALDPTDDECLVGSNSEACAASFRQLRVKGATAEVAPHTHEEGSAAVNAELIETGNDDDEGIDQDAMSDNEDDPDDDPEEGVPGGWGEAAAYVNSLPPDEQKALNTSLQPGNMSLQPSYYRRHRRRWHHHHHHSSHYKVLTLYHQTSHYAANLIVKTGFRPGTQGWCGGGIYFAMSPEATQTKAIGPDSQKGAMLQAQVNVGRVQYMSKTCNRGLHGPSPGFDSVSFNPGDGQEYVVYQKSKVISVKQIGFR